MNKKHLPAQREYESLMNHYWFIFLNYKFRKIYSHSKDKKAILTGFIICLMRQQIGDKKTHHILYVNRKLFLAFFKQLEGNEDMWVLYKIFETTPNITIETINSYKKCFNSSIELFLSLMSQTKTNLNLPEETIKEILEAAFIYLVYSLVDCTMEKTIDEILADPEYDNKVKKIMNNTKLFSKLKLLIMKECGNLTSDFIGLINGMTPILGKD